MGASKTNTFGERYRRIARRRGKKRALVAVGRSVLTIIWHLLSDPDAVPFVDLGPSTTPTASEPTAPSATTSAASTPLATP